MTKLIVIIGITGNQGASVADVYLNEPGWKIRGISRDPIKAASKEWSNKGVEMVQGDLNDINSLKRAFKGANVIFGMTDFWFPFFDKANYSKLKPGQTINEFCLDLEVQTGKNIAIAAASVDTLERFVFSLLSNANKWSKGKYTWVYHFDAKAKVGEYIAEELPELNKKMSILQIGLFATNWKIPLFTPQQQPDGSFLLSLPGGGNRLMPMVVTRKDTGYFVRALVQTAPGKNLLGAGSFISWRDYMKLWAKIQGVPEGKYREITVADMDKMAPGGVGREIAEAHAYMEEFGYDGGDPTVIRPEDLGVDCPTTSIEEYIKGEDFSSIMSGPPQQKSQYKSKL